jgi:hypothetical protein
MLLGVVEIAFAHLIGITTIRTGILIELADLSSMENKIILTNFTA